MVVLLGTTATVDVSDAFVGSVTSYAVRSSRTSVTVSVNGAVVSLQAVRSGGSFVTVTASNAAGSASQRFFVEIPRPPPPRMTLQVTDQSLSAGALAAFDVPDSFGGHVTSYTVTSSDETLVSAALDNKVAVVRAVAEGSATVTFRAANLIGAASMSFAVTVTAAVSLPAAPTRTTTSPAAQEVVVGGMLEVDVSDAFAGAATAQWLAVSDDRTIAEAEAPTGATVALTGVATGTTTVRVVAFNAGGLATADVAVTVVVPPPLAITATAPTHCLTGEGTPTTIGNNTGREGIATVAVAYTVTGGAAPYTITNDANNISTTSPTGTGTINVTCARPGINIFDVHPTANAVESGPKTITVTVTDTDTTAATDTTTVTVQIVEDVVTTNHNDGTLAAGKTYAIGDRTQPILITLPTGLNLKFDELYEVNGEYDTVHFIDTVSGSRIILDWSTASEVARRIVQSGSAGARTDAGTGLPRDVGALFDAFVASASTSDDVPSNAGTAPTIGKNWRPYKDLPGEANVLLHERILKGDTLMVCNAAMKSDFHLEDFGFSALIGTSGEDTKKQSLLDKFNLAFGDAITTWNNKLHRPKDTDGTPSKVFEKVTDNTKCDPAHFTPDTEISASVNLPGVDIFVHRRSEGGKDKCGTEPPDPLLPAWEIWDDCTKVRAPCGSEPKIMPSPAWTQWDDCNRRYYVGKSLVSKALGSAWRPTSRVLMPSNRDYHTIITTTKYEEVAGVREYRARFAQVITHELGQFLGSRRLRVYELP